MPAGFFPAVAPWTNQIKEATPKRRGSVSYKNIVV